MSNRSKNADNGVEAAKTRKLRKAAVAAKGRHNQPRGSGAHNASPRQAKMQKTSSVNWDDVEF